MVTVKPHQPQEPHMSKWSVPRLETSFESDQSYSAPLPPASSQQLPRRQPNHQAHPQPQKQNPIHKRPADFPIRSSSPYHHDPSHHPDIDYRSDRRIGEEDRFSRGEDLVTARHHSRKGKEVDISQSTSRQPESGTRHQLDRRTDRSTDYYPYFHTGLDSHRRPYPSTKPSRGEDYTRTYPYSHPYSSSEVGYEYTSSSSSFDIPNQPSAPVKSDSSLPDLLPPPPAHQRYTMRPAKSSPLNPNPTSPPIDTGYISSDTGAESYTTAHRRRPKEAHDILEEMPEIMHEMNHMHQLEELGEMSDQVIGLPRDHDFPGMKPLGAGFTNGNPSEASVGSRNKADKVLGLDPNAKLTSFYLVSGLPRDYSEWSFADTEATRGLRPTENSMGHWWRPDILGSAFSGQQSDDWMREVHRARKDSKSSGISTNHLSHAKAVKAVHVPDAGPDGASKILMKTMKYAHPRDLEVLCSSTSPPHTTHAFSFTIPKHDTLATIARSRLDGSMSRPLPPSSQPVDYNAFLTPEESTQIMIPDSNGTRNMSSATELTFYGLTLTVWTHADKHRARALKHLRTQKDRIAQGAIPETLRPPPLSKAVTERLGSGKRRTSLPWGLSRKGSLDNFSASETETGMSDSDFDGPLGRRSMKSAFNETRSIISTIPDEPVIEDGPTHFWLPYAITLISRYPIFDFMQDFLRLSWTRYQKNAKHHMEQVCRLLMMEPPRPGEFFTMTISSGQDEKITIEAKMPGASDFDRGIVSHVDFQIWPMFQALDLDHIITCIEVALTSSGRIIFISSHPSMLNICVSTLKFIVDLRGWSGIAYPIIHARDMGFVVEDPGPYILGMPSECQNMIRIPSEVVVVDIDINTLTCDSPPPGAITSKQKREKMKHKLFAAFGTNMPLEKTVPREFMLAYPTNTFRHTERIWYPPGARPSFLGTQIKPPAWWKHSEVISAFDKIMADKHEKPSLLERLTRSGMAKQKAQPTRGEFMAKMAMRHRALHYVETRDSLEIRVSTVNRRLQKLIVEGEHWRMQFERFEKYAEKLTQDSNDLKAKIEREKKEAKRLSAVATEKTQANAELEEKLKNTENARARAMRQLSDMHQSIQELEKEREDIMSHFENQLNTVLAGVPVGDDDSRPSTPTESVVGSPTSRTTALKGVRPSTRDSNKSSMSKYTVESSLSVLGAAKGVQPSAYRRKNLRPGTGSTVGGSDGDEKVDGISARIAALTAKLEYALSNVATHQRSSLDTSRPDVFETDVQAVEGTGGKDPGQKGVPPIDDDEAEEEVATPVPRRRTSTVTFKDAPDVPHIRDEQTIDETETNDSPNSSLTTEEGPDGYSTPHSSPDDASLKVGSLSGRERKVSNGSVSSNHLMRPGVSLRIKRQRSAGEISTFKESTEIDDDNEFKGHEKMSTSSSGQSEMIVTPSLSSFDIDSEPKIQVAQSDAPAVKEECIGDQSVVTEEHQGEEAEYNKEINEKHRIPFANVS